MDRRAEEDLPGWIAGGGPEVWGRFLDEYAPVIFGVVRLFAVTYDERMDLFLHACAKLQEDGMRRVRSFRRRPDAPCRFSTYLSVVTRNICIDCLRSRDGRLRPFRIVEGMEETDRLLFEYHLREGRSLEETRSLLKGRHGIRLSDGEVARRAEHVAGSLSANQRWRLLARLAGRRRTLPIDTVTGAALGTGAPVSLPSEAGNPEQPLRSRAAERALAEALAALPPRQRLALALRYRDGLPVRDVACFMKIPSAEAERLSSKALGSLRERCRRSGVTRPDLEAAGIAFPWPQADDAGWTEP